jgi:hypothetical protein
MSDTQTPDTAPTAPATPAAPGINYEALAEAMLRAQGKANAPAKAADEPKKRNPPSANLGRLAFIYRADASAPIVGFCTREYLDPAGYADFIAFEPGGAAPHAIVSVPPDDYCWR